MKQAMIGDGDHGEGECIEPDRTPADGPRGVGLGQLVHSRSWSHGLMR